MLAVLVTVPMVAMSGVLAVETASIAIAITITFAKHALIIDASSGVILTLWLMANVQRQRVTIYKSAKDWCSMTRTIAQFVNAVASRPVNHAHPTRIACPPVEVA